MGRAKRRTQIVRWQRAGAIGLSLVATLIEPVGAHRPGRTELVSKTVQPCVGAESGESGSPSVSASGRYVAFESTDPCLVVPDATAPASALQDVFISDRLKGEKGFVSVSSSGIQGIGRSSLPDINPSGRYVAFTSDAPNLVPGDTNLAIDVFLRDLRLGSTERISLDSEGDQVENPGASAADRRVSINANGRYVAFSSSASHLVAEDTNGFEDAFVRDRKTGETRRVSLASDGVQGNGASSVTSISSDGRYVTLGSSASNLVANDTNGFSDAFVADLHAGSIERVSIASDGTQGTMGGGPIGISDDGRYVLIISQSGNLVPRDTYFGGIGADAFVHDRVTRRTQRVSVTSFGGEGTDGAVIGGGAISGNGKVVSFGTAANDLACCGDTGFSSPILPITGDHDVLTHEIESGATEYVSIGQDGQESTGCFPGTASAYSAWSDQPSINVDGRFLAFRSCTENLEPDDSGVDWDIFLRDRGLPLGVGEIEGPEEEPSGGICVDDVCVPPGRSLSTTDSVADLDTNLTRVGANLFGASLVHRPEFRDLFLAIELHYMQPVTPGPSPVYYGIEFDVAGRDYEVRATSLHGGTFELYECSASSRCLKVSDLRGGYGTTGMRVVFSVPLASIGLSEGGTVEDLRAFSALEGARLAVPQVLDSVRLR